MSDEFRKDITFADERKKAIVEYVNKNKKTTVKHLCESFNVSPATIRNDLRELEERGLLKRAHGGAISNSKTIYELKSEQKKVSDIKEKQAIARAAINYIEDGDSIALDTGTTTFELAKLLVNKQQLVIVTNDLHIAMFLENNTNFEIIVVGGMIRSGYNCMVGPLGAAMMENLSVDKSFMSTNGLDINRGATTPSVDMAQIKKEMINMADEVILLCLSKKVGKIAFAKFADVCDFDSIILNEGVPADSLEEIKNLCGDIEVANVN